jgi:O-antigen biosynthesis protein
LPEQYRFSRAIVVFGACAAFLLISVQRWLLVKAKLLLEPLDATSRPHILVAASKEEYDSINAFLQEKGFGQRIIGRIGINGTGEHAIAHINTIETTAEALNAKELIFCAASLSHKRIIDLTESLHTRLRFRYHAKASSSIVGSDTSTESGEILSAETDFAIARASSRRLKRLIDVIFFL